MSLFLFRGTAVSFMLCEATAMTVCQVDVQVASVVCEGVIWCAGLLVKGSCRGGLGWVRCSQWATTAMISFNLAKWRRLTGFSQRLVHGAEKEAEQVFNVHAPASTVNSNIRCLP